MITNVKVIDRSLVSTTDLVATLELRNLLGCVRGAEHLHDMWVHALSEELSARDQLGQQ